MTHVFPGLDYYKLTMSQQAWKIAPNAQVTFTLKNRGPQRLLDRVSVEELEEELFAYRVFPFSNFDLGYLNRRGIFDGEYVQYLLTTGLPYPHVTVQDGDIHVEVTGSWPVATFWETVVMASINEIWFSKESKEDRARHLTLGHKNLSQAITALRERPYINFSDFGTRRRYSLSWHYDVVHRLATELPDQFNGTSNPYLAKEFGLKPIGTFAHEMPMVYAARWDGIGDFVHQSHNLMLDDWYATYGEEFSIALTDTFGTEFFFNTFTQEQAETWRGLRHDSGDPFAFALRAIEFYKSRGIDPLTKTLVFSDGLDLTTILALSNFRDRINVTFGWGTGLTNNVGVAPLNIVMKATSVDGVGTVKLSDDAGKHTGSAEDVSRYLEYVRKYVS